MNHHYENQTPSSGLNEFTDEEIREQLEYLGFKNVSKEKFKQFKDDLEKLIAQEVSINSNTSYSDYYQNRKASNEFENSRMSNSMSPNEIFNSDEKYLKNKKVTFPNDSHLVNGINDDNDGEIDEEIDQSFASIITTSSIVDNKVMKRKIIKKSNQHSQTKTDERPSLNEASLNNMMKTCGFEYDIDENEIYEPNSEFEDEQDEQLIKLNEHYPPIQYPMKSVIRSKSSLSIKSDTSTTLKKKSNPVTKFQQYEKLWKAQKVPGEKKHSDLRWSIREQMLAKDVIVKRQSKPLESNEYVIPTEKKRKDLIWAVRSALANQVE